MRVCVRTAFTDIVTGFAFFHTKYQVLFAKLETKY